MKNMLVIAGLIVALAGCAGAGEDTKLDLKDQKNRVSYSIGVSIANSLKREQMNLNADAIAVAIKDVMSGAKLRLSDEEMQSSLMALQKQASDQATQMAAKNKDAGAAFLAANKAKEGVTTTASGLQYKILKKGEGKTPTATDRVTAHYRGTLIDGTEFDSSYKRGQPTQFPVGGVIQGWQEALQMMPVGSKWQLVVPPNLGYGEHGAGGVIGPNAVLVFEVELVSIEEPGKQTGPQ